jgi:hypothetical protein
MKKNTITKTAIFTYPWNGDPSGDQFIDLEIFLNWLKTAIQDAAPTSDGVQLCLCTVDTFPHLELSWTEQENKTSKRVQKAISKIKRKQQRRKRGKTK